MFIIINTKKDLKDKDLESIDIFENDYDKFFEEEPFEENSQLINKPKEFNEYNDPDDIAIIPEIYYKKI
jgi:hypothetical protein